MSFLNKKSYKKDGETQLKENLDTSEDNDIIRLSDFESIAEKIKGMPRVFDLQAYQLDLTEKEQRIVSALEIVAKVSLFNEFKHLKDKINNHHHVSLSVSDGVKFRENGNRIQRPEVPAAGTGTAR